MCEKSASIVREGRQKREIIEKGKKGKPPLRNNLCPAEREKKRGGERESV